ncbi:MAG: OsmC family protein [Pseudobdellovibrio sp.]
MVRMSAIYTGEKHCQALHEPSQSIIETDAPKDIQGRGEKFSPTDLMATALGTCILTTIAMVAERDGYDLKNSKISVEKEMSANPRRISSLKTVIDLPKSIPEEYRNKIEQTAAACPAKKSFHPEILIPIEFRYSL